MAQSEKVTFKGAMGETLAARLDKPLGPPKAYALFAHCFSCSKDILAASRISRELTRVGLAVLRFDFTGLGQSDGDFSNTNFTSNIEDLIKAAEFLESEYRAPALLVGHSLGGAAVIAAATKLPSVKAVATIGAPADAEHVKKQFCDDVETIREKGEADVQLAGRTFRLQKQFLDDIEGHTLIDIVGSLKAALLIAHSPIDEVVSIDNATNLFKAARHSKSFISLDDADHLLSDQADAIHIARIIGSWALRHIDDLDMTEPPDVPSEPRSAVVAETGLGVFHSYAYAGAHQLMMDEPEDVGGDNGGPTPYQMLSLALAGCTTMTLRMYARHKDWNLGRIRTEVVHTKDKKAASDAPADVFQRRVFIDDDLNQEQWDKVLEIADKCPVHRTLERGSKVETSTDNKA